MTEPSAEALVLAAQINQSMTIGRPQGTEIRMAAQKIYVFVAAAVDEARNDALDDAARLVEHHPFADDADEDCRDSQGCCEHMAAQIRALKS